MSTFNGKLNQAGRVLWITAPSTAPALLGGFALAFVGQSVESIRVAAEDAAVGDRAAFWTLLVAVGYGALMAWYWARVLLYLDYERDDVNKPTGSWFLVRVPRVAGLVLPYAMLLGIKKAMASVAPDSSGTRAWLWALWILVALGAIGLMIFVVKRRVVIDRYRARHGEPASVAPQSTPGATTTVKGLPTESRVVLGMAAALWVILLFIITPSHGFVVRFMGPLGILLLSVASWIAIVSTLAHAGRAVGIPLVSAIALVVFGSSYFNLNDNHEARSWLDQKRPAAQRYDSAFTQWIQHRADTAQYDAYPVFFVTTEGGGLRAAYFTSLVLAAIQDRCPAFAQHTFAISSVSGGSVGAGLFAASIAREVKNAPQPRCADSVAAVGHFQRLADSVLQRDFLTPLFAKALFPDLIQRGIPAPIGYFDRATALEKGFEAGWTSATGGDTTLNGSFYGLWKDFAAEATPSLFLNTTRVETGDRMVISNMHPIGPRFDHIVSLTDVNSKLDLPLSTAMTLSARFPIVTPVGGVSPGEPHKLWGHLNRYADGGYFDNSGAATLMELVSSLRPGEGRPCGRRGHPCFVPIIIRIGFDVKGAIASGDTSSKYTATGLNEVLSPIRTLLNTRDARAATTVEQLRTAIEIMQEHLVPTELVEFELTEDKVPLVLGWLLSTQARREMARQMDPQAQCPDPNTVSNACSMRRVAMILNQGLQTPTPIRLERPRQSGGPTAPRRVRRR